MEGLYQDKYKIKSTRLSNWDYSSSAYYFVTICTHNRIEYLGEVLRDNRGEWSVALSDAGEIVRDGLLNVPAIYANVRLDAWVIMPNHIHVIFEITSSVRNAPSHGFVETPHWGVSTGERNPQHHPEWKPGVLGSIINQFKGAVTRQCRESGFGFVWQRLFYDHIIRTEISLYNIREYIKNNPRMWYRDRNNPEGLLI
ncbi:MAG: transposase [Parcubacteria group bacterium]|nr:transposase [Parcubacteria group bacterium]